MWIKKLPLLLLLVVFAACSGSEEEEIIDAHPIPVIEEIQGVIFDGENLEPDNEFEAAVLEIPPLNEYIVSLNINPEERLLHGISRISFTNRSEEPLEQIKLRVYLNAFLEDHHPRPYPEELAWRVYRPSVEPGFLTIEYASMNNETLYFDMEGTVLILHLEEAIEPNATVQLLLQYSAYVPPLWHFMGGNDAAMWFGMVLPVLAVHDGAEWVIDNFYPIGMPFVFETANFDVTVTTPLTYNVVGTGHRTEEIIEDTGIKITRFAANMSRDFAFAVLSPEFERVNITAANGVEINFYHRTEIPSERTEEILKLVDRSMTHFDYRFGIYPFGQINIVEADVLNSTIAFSQMIFVNSFYLGSGNLMRLANSVGSQWTANVVGADRINYPWLEHGLALFAQAEIFFDTPELLQEYMEREHRVISHRAGLSLSHGLNRYTSVEPFESTHGRKAMLMLNALQQHMGEDEFWRFINLYYQEFSFQIAMGSDFIRLAEEVYGDSLTEFFEEWFAE